jgi:predicted nucleic acid-binding protein
MNGEFIDTNVLVYAHDGGAGAKHHEAARLMARLSEDGTAALSLQVLSEFYAIATQKLGRKSEEVEQIIRDLRAWNIHRPAHADLLRAASLHRRYKTSWWDALIINSAIQLGCTILWSEDLNSGQNYQSVRVRNPFL